MLMKLGVGALAGVLGLSVGAGVATQQYGTVVVRVEEKWPGGDSFTIPVPLALARVAAGFVPTSHLGEHAGDLQLASELAALVADELAAYPDTVLVEVTDRHESVLVHTTDSDLVVDVNSDHERVYVRVPLWGASQVLEALANKAN